MIEVPKRRIVRKFERWFYFEGSMREAVVMSNELGRSGYEYASMKSDGDKVVVEFVFIEMWGDKLFGEGYYEVIENERLKDT